MQAEQRQREFEKSAVGRAAYTAEKEVRKKPAYATAGRESGGGVDVRDWQS
jgi:hypothetical protein